MQGMKDQWGHWPGGNQYLGDNAMGVNGLGPAEVAH